MNKYELVKVLYHKPFPVALFCPYIKHFCFFQKQITVETKVPALTPNYIFVNLKKQKKQKTFAFIKVPP